MPWLRIRFSCPSGLSSKTKPTASLDEPWLVAAFVLAQVSSAPPELANTPATALQRGAQTLNGSVLLAAHSHSAAFEPPCLPARHRKTNPDATELPSLVQRFSHVVHVARRPPVFSSLPYVQPFRACHSYHRSCSDWPFQRVEPTSSLLPAGKDFSQFGTVSDGNHWQAVSAAFAPFPPLMVELFAVSLFTRTPGSHLVPGRSLLRAPDSPRQPKLNEPPSGDHGPLGGIFTHFAQHGSNVRLAIRVCHCRPGT